MTFDVAIADSLHAQARNRFAVLVQRATTLKAEGADDERAVAELVTQLGVSILDRNGTPEFWDALWSVCAVAAHAAVKEVKP
jgi:hypothetical protein